ncbi:MAG: hypothetical protein NC131_15905 [Roseburia sp.]|nr:hypothetical protein [Roseburia sp.]
MMEEKIINSDFLNRVVEVTKELSSLIENATDGKHRGIVILAAEEVNEQSSANVVGISGRKKEVCSALHDFATQSATSDIFKRVATGGSYQFNFQ